MKKTLIITALLTAAFVAALAYTGVSDLFLILYAFDWLPWS